MDFLRTRTRLISRTARDRAVMRKLYDNVDHADAPLSTSGRLTPQVGNPGFIAQFDIVVIPKYFTVAVGVYTAVTAAAVAGAQPTLATQLPVFLFGNSDKSGGFRKMRAQFPLSGWSYDTPFIYGSDSGAGTTFGTLDATAKGVLQVGDLVLPVTAVLGGVNYVAFSIIRCSQTAYGSLLDATNSDSFRMNMVRYILSDSTATSLAQYLNQLQPFNLSIFGKFNSDQTSPNSFKIPEQQQQNIIDIPLVLDVDKQVSIGTYMNYDLPTQMQLSFFVAEVVKVAR